MVNAQADAQLHVAVPPGLSFEARMEYLGIKTLGHYMDGDVVDAVVPDDLHRPG